ncbi:CheF family chemotaxis protein [Halosimplex aquaticum]|uniref:CheF family chemotaxis protein n=1 Tax=Halosimplex aquaticum TaxID=3026162 RepID=A0ABD5Y4R5_9EURY|nr:CheF family chemotaxis protein [Halosimplex aquaticum]
MSDWPPLDRTLDPGAFYSLYRGALAAESVQRRLGRCYTVLLAGRLGLRPDEIVHCHEGWIDWGRGELRVPALDPCACPTCWASARARQATGDERPLETVLRTEQWSPHAEAGARTVAFGWSERITAVLATFFDYVDHLDGDVTTVRELVTETAAAAEGIDPDGLTPQVLRATGGRFLAEAGFDATSVRNMLGLDEREPAEAFVRYAGQRTSAAVYSAFDRGAVGPEVPPAEPARTFPIVCDPAPFSREPFDAADYGPDARFERAKNEAGRRVRNPRPDHVPDGFDYDPDEHETAEQADPEGGQYSRSAGADAKDMAALRDWVRRKDASLRPESESADGDEPVAPTVDGDWSGAADPGEGPPAEPTPLDTAADGASAESAARAPAGGVGAGEDARSAEPTTVEEAVTQPLVARVGTHFVTPGVAEGHPVEGQVVLGQNELLLVSPATGGDLTGDGVAFDLLSLDSVVDVIPDVDEATDVPFDSALGVVVRRGDDHEVAVVELDPGRKWDFWLALFRNALHVSRMSVTHPARVGGRVTDESATPGMLYLDRDRVRFTPLGSDATILSVDLDDVLHVERTKQSVDGERRPALAVQQFVDGEAVTSLVGSDSTRTLALFERFVRRDYQDRLDEARALAIPDREKEVLVALYSIGEGVDLSAAFAREEEVLRSQLASLDEKGLVTGTDPDDTGLTATGRLVVGDRLEAVND